MLLKKVLSRTICTPLEEVRMNIIWRIEDATIIVNKLIPALKRAGFSVGITGSVLYKGSSTKDLDLIIYPMNAASFSNDKAVKVLVKNGFVLDVPHSKVTAYWEEHNKEPTDTKYVDVWKYNGKRVDIMWLK